MVVVGALWRELARVLVGVVRWVGVGGCLIPLDPLDPLEPPGPPWCLWQGLSGPSRISRLARARRRGAPAPTARVAVVEVGVVGAAGVGVRLVLVLVRLRVWVGRMGNLMKTGSWLRVGISTTKSCTPKKKSSWREAR